ncbi:hypothetical protein SAMN02745857_03586 [Andreprevotia lacus DSM 23236]|uniref:Uncharacterized protein n=1 Tax=Andreprevotia lacus DSM 23236 TaxID=1121001 RepID=A0A1W1XYY9_9NEIS|nr:hypothetical protein [Andreprevotia lacus]SMC29084.1 hypothetical protein SAMN02745857_03586 [Andreprevotia lacus DSM 23236]
MSQHPLYEQTELALRDEADVQGTLAALTAQIRQAPDDPQWYRLRIKLLQGIGKAPAAWRDLYQLLALTPTDRTAALELALNQYQWAFRLVTALDASPETFNNPDAHARWQQMATLLDWPQHRADGENWLKQDALARLEALLAAHSNDPAFVQDVLAQWPLTARDGWQRYTQILNARSHHPRDFALRKAEALQRYELAGEGGGDGDTAPAGYLETYSGARWSALKLAEVRELIEALLDEQGDDELFDTLGDLLETTSDYPAAAALRSRHADWLGSQPTDPADADAAEVQQERIIRLRTQAAACQRGLEGVANLHLAQMQASIEAMQASMARFTADLSSWSKVGDAPGAETLDGALTHDLDQSMADLAVTLRKEVAQRLQGPNAEELATLRKTARRLAGNTLSVIFTPEVVLRPLDPASAPDGPLPWFAEHAAELLALGLQRNVFFENLWTNKALGKQSQSELWLEPTQRCALTLDTAVGTQNRLRRIFSQLSDGTLLLTADTAGRGFWRAGHGTALITTPREMSTTSMLALHRAHLAVQLAQDPQLQVTPIDGLARLAELENQMQRNKQRAYEQDGITEDEVLGMHVRHHAAFSRLIKAEIQQQLLKVRANGGIYAPASPWWQQLLGWLGLGGRR